jgi:hypothetical protein
MKSTAYEIAAILFLPFETIFLIGNEELTQLAIINSEQNSTGHDILVLFSSFTKAEAYRDKYPNLHDSQVIPSKPEDLDTLLDDKIPFFVLDRE